MMKITTNRESAISSGPPKQEKYLAAISRSVNVTQKILKNIIQKEEPKETIRQYKKSEGLTSEEVSPIMNIDKKISILKYIQSHLPQFLRDRFYQQIGEDQANKVIREKSLSSHISEELWQDWLMVAEDFDYRNINNLSEFLEDSLLDKWSSNREHFKFSQNTTVQKFIWDNRRYVLKEPVEGIIEFEDKYWIFKVPKYNLCSFSEDRYEALLQINEEFDCLYCGIVKEDESNLSADSIMLRDILKNDIKEVEEYNG
jgi:hypothetical protein